MLIQRDSLTLHLILADEACVARALAHTKAQCDGAPYDEAVDPRALDRPRTPWRHDAMRSRGGLLSGVLLLVAGCGRELPRDHGRLWDCVGFVERNGQTVAAFPFDTKIRLCANPDVPVPDLKE